MTINEAIYSIFDGLNISTDDFPIRKRFVYNQLCFTINELKKQELNKFRLLDNGSGQTLECFTLIREDWANCDGCETGDFILRSEEELPAVIETDFGLAITGVFFLNGVIIPKTTKNDWQNRKKRRYSLSDACGYLIENNRLIVVGFDETEEIDVNVDGHFERPELVSLRNKLKDSDCDNGKCISIPDLEFKCPGHIFRRAVEIVRPVMLQALGIPTDTNNNSKFDVSNVQSKTQPQS